MKYEAQKKTAVVQKVIRRLNLVAWTGIEPVTRGFSIAMLVKSPAFMRVAREKRVTCDISCYSQITEYRITFLFYQREKTCQVQQFLATAGAVKILLLFSAPANLKNIHLIRNAKFAFCISVAFIVTIQLPSTCQQSSHVLLVIEKGHD